MPMHCGPSFCRVYSVTRTRTQSWLSNTRAARAAADLKKCSRVDATRHVCNTMSVAPVDDARLTQRSKQVVAHRLAVDWVGRAGCFSRVVVQPGRCAGMHGGAERTVRLPQRFQLCGIKCSCSALLSNCLSRCVLVLRDNDNHASYNLDVEVQVVWVFIL